MHQDVEALADDLVALSFSQSPLSAAMLGMDEIDGDLEDLSQSADDDARRAYEAIASRASGLAASPQGDVDGFDGTDLLAIDHVRLSAEARANRLHVPLTGFTVSNYYVAPLSSMVAVLPQLSVDSSIRQGRYVRRLRALPTYLEQAARRHHDAVAAGATPTARGVRVAIEQVDDVLGDPDLRGLRRRGADDADRGFAAAQDTAIEEVVRPALAAYREELADLFAHGRLDERCGMSWMTGGAAMYQRLIEFSTWSNRSAQEIHEIGLELIERLREEFAVVGARLWGTSDYATIRDRILTDPVLRFDTSDEILATAIEAVRRAEAEAPKWFGLMPKDPCAVAPIPDALASGAAVAYYFGGALDGSRPGTYFVNTTKPEIRNRHVAQSIAFHEACPGHHFQLTIAQEKAGSHLVFRVTRDGTNAEGWGLYSERLADEMGLYTDDVALLGMLTTEAMRAARLVVDTGIHALGWSRDQAVTWMTANVPLGEPDIIQEIDRYIVSPGQALSYMFGRFEIDRLRASATEELGDTFDLRAFHDMVLATGPVALPAFTAAVERWVNLQR